MLSQQFKMPHLSIKGTVCFTYVPVAFEQAFSCEPTFFEELVASLQVFFYELFVFSLIYAFYVLVLIGAIFVFFEHL